MKQYRKKPVVITAALLNESSQEEILTWIAASGTRCRSAGKGITISTLEGDMTGSYGDYIIQGVQGEFYPCKPDIFEATYEEVK